MVGLLDLAPVAEKVTIGDAYIDVPGISATGIALLLLRFPQLGALAIDEETLKSGNLLALGEEIVGAIGAAGCGYPNNREAEAKFAALGVGVQVDILDAIIRMTMPEGFGPFVEKLKKLTAVFRSEPEGTASPPRSQRRPRGSRPPIPGPTPSE
jgi:hypothetical protein